MSAEKLKVVPARAGEAAERARIAPRLVSRMGSSDLGGWRRTSGPVAGD
jgi:hypothetical protein